MSPKHEPRTPSQSFSGELLVAAASSENAALVDALAGVVPIHDIDLGVDANGVARKMVAVKSGHALFDVKPLLDIYRTAPERREGTAKFTDLESFVSHVRRFADEDSVVFANDSQASPSLTCILDYHRRTADGAPRFGRHRSAYAFPLSEEWQAWVKSNKQGMEQAEFAHFIEDRLADVADPDELKPEGGAATWARKLGMQFAHPSKVLELSRGLEARVKQIVRGAHNPGNGDGEVSFATTVEDPNGQPLRVPGAFAIAIPIFKRGDLWPVPVRLRYRISGAITWFYELARVDQVFETAFAEALGVVCHGRGLSGEKGHVLGTGLPILRGSPE